MVLWFTLFQPKKLNKDQILKKIQTGFNNNDAEDNLHKGEYMVKEDRVFVRLFSPKTTIYEVELKIGGTSMGKFDRLKFESHYMKVLGQEGSITMRTQGHMNKSFKFVRAPEFVAELPNSHLRASYVWLSCFVWDFQQNETYFD